jgi:hypothetical protein
MNFIHKLLFDLKISDLKGTEFEEFFCKIMKCAFLDFQKVKPYGNIGDRKCDAYNQTTGDYYLIYAPENIQKESTQKNAISKISADIRGIVKNWNNIKQINYVINTKNDDLPPDVCRLFIEIQEDLALPKIKTFSMRELKDVFLSLSEHYKEDIVGFAPSIAKIKVDFLVLSEVIKYLEKNYTLINTSDSLVVPDFSEKIQFNNLSNKTAELLNNARIDIVKVEDFFNQTTDFDKGILKNYLTTIYQEACATCPITEDNRGDKIFIRIFDKLCYTKDSRSVANCVLVIMATFFESCDIFEEPPQRRS